MGLTGSYLPFAKTAAERQASGDPRRSLQERYTDRAGFVRAVEDAARALVTERFLLQEDADRFIAAARTTDARAGDRGLLDRRCPMSGPRTGRARAALRYTP